MNCRLRCKDVVKTYKHANSAEKSTHFAENRKHMARECIYFYTIRKSYTTKSTLERIDTSISLEVYKHSKLNKTKLERNASAREIRVVQNLWNVDQKSRFSRNLGNRCHNKKYSTISRTIKSLDATETEADIAQLNSLDGTEEKTQKLMNPWKFLLYEFSINDRNTLTFSQFKAIVKILEGYNAANQKGKLEELKALFAEEGSIDKRGKVNIIDNDAEKNRGEDLEWNLSKLWSCYAYYVLKCEGYCFTDGKYATQKLYYKGYHTHNVGLCMNLIIDNSDGSLVSKDFLKMSYERFGFGVASRAERSLELASKHFELYIENIGKDMRMMLDSKKHGSSGRIIQPEEYDNLGIMYEAANNCMDILQLKISRAKLGGKKALADKEYITKEIGEIFKTIDQIVGMLQKRNCIQMAIHLVLRLEQFLDYDNQFTNSIIRCYNKLISYYSKISDGSNMVVTLLYKMEKVINDFPPQRTWNIIIAGLLNRGNHMGAMKLFSVLLEKSGVLSRKEIFELGGYSRYRLDSNYQHYFNTRTRDSNNFYKIRQIKYSPNSEIYSTLIAGFKKNPKLANTLRQYFEVLKRIAKPKPTQLSTFSLAMLRSSEVRAHYLANFVKGFSEKLEGQATTEDTSSSLEEKQDKVTNEVVNAMLLGCANDQNIEQMCTVIRLWPDLVDIKSLFHVLVLVLKQFYRTSTRGFDHSGVKNSGYIDSKDIYGLIDRYTGIRLLNTDSIAEASSSNIQNEYMHNERQSFSEQNQHVSHGISENKVDDSDLIFLINFLELKFFADKDILLQRQYLLKSNQFILSKLIDLLLNVVGFDLGTVVRFYKQNFIESAAILNIFVKHLVSTHGIHYAFQFVKICSFNFAQEKNYFVGTDEMCQLPASHPDSLNSRSTLDSKRNAAAFDEHDSILLSELYCPPVSPDHITRTILLRNLASSANPKDARLYSKIASFFTEKLFPLPLN